MKILSTKYTRKTLLKCTQRVLNRQRPIVIIVTGSMGKTTTHAAVAQVVSAKYRTKIITTNDNNGRGPLLGFFGMSLPQKAHSTRFWLKALAKAKKMSWKFPYDAVVLEISDSAYDSLKDFLELIQADYCVVTGIAKVHMSKFQTEANLLSDIVNITKTAKQVVYNTDFAALKNAFGKTSAISYGTTDAEYSFTAKRNIQNGNLQNTITYKDKPWLEYNSKFIATHALYAQTAAAVIGKELTIPDELIATELSLMPSLKGRLNVFTGIRNSIIIDDTYNANAESMIAAVKLLGEFSRNKVALLGSINELDSFAKTEHQRVGESIAKYPDEVYIYGSDAAQFLAPALLTAGFDKNNLKIFATSRQAGQYLKDHLQPNSVVIAKGSQNDVFSEEAIKPLLVNKNDISKLVRQSDYWMKIKQKSFNRQEEGN